MTDPIHVVSAAMARQRALGTYHADGRDVSGGGWAITAAGDKRRELRRCLAVSGIAFTANADDTVTTIMKADLYGTQDFSTVRRAGAFLAGCIEFEGHANGQLYDDPVPAKRTLFLDACTKVGMLVRVEGNKVWTASTQSLNDTFALGHLPFVSYRDWPQPTLPPNPPASTQPGRELVAEPSPTPDPDPVLPPPPPDPVLPPAVVPQPPPDYPPTVGGDIVPAAGPTDPFQSAIGYIPADNAMSGFLGCERLYVSIYSRSGKVLHLADLAWTSVTWVRRLNDLGYAAIELDGAAGCFDYDEVLPREHQLVIERSTATVDGDRRARVFNGPITDINVTPDYGTVRVSAHDVMWWASQRRIHSDHTWLEGTDLLTCFSDVLADAIGVDNAPGIVIDSRGSSVALDTEGGRTVTAGQNRMAWDMLGEFTRTAVDWTVIGDTVVLRGLDVSDRVLPLLTDEHFESFGNFSISAEDAPTRVVVSGSGRGETDDALAREARSLPDAEATFGVVEQVFSEATIRDFDSAQRAADSVIDEFEGRPKWVFSGGNLNSTAPFTVDDLVPGHHVPLHLGSTGAVPSVVGTYRFTTIEVYVGPESARCTVGLAPLGTIIDRST